MSASALCFQVKKYLFFKQTCLSFWFKHIQIFRDGIVSVADGMTGFLDFVFQKSLTEKICGDFMIDHFKRREFDTAVDENICTLTVQF